MHACLGLHDRGCAAAWGRADDVPRVRGFRHACMREPPLLLLLRARARAVGRSAAMPYRRVLQEWSMYALQMFHLLRPGCLFT